MKDWIKKQMTRNNLVFSMLILGTFYQSAAPLICILLVLMDVEGCLTDKDRKKRA